MAHDVEVGYLEVEVTWDPVSVGDGERIAYRLACPRCAADFVAEVPIGAADALADVAGAFPVGWIGPQPLEQGTPIFLWCRCGNDHGKKDAGGCGAWGNHPYGQDS